MMANAHNYTHNALPIYHFFGDLQFHEVKAGLSIFSLPPTMPFTFLPRIKYEEVILSKAEWRFKTTNLAFLKLKDENMQFDEIQKWRDEWKIPRRICLMDGEMELFIDLENPLFVALFCSEVSKKKMFNFCEFIETSQPFIQDENNQEFINEFICFFTKKEKITNPKTISPSPQQKIQKVKRKFIFGSEWLYYKIYLGKKTADLLLVHLKPLIEKLLYQQKISHWFFIKYEDPDNHLRLRFHIPDSSNLQNVGK